MFGLPVLLSMCTVHVALLWGASVLAIARSYSVDMNSNVAFEFAKYKHDYYLSQVSDSYSDSSEGSDHWYRDDHDRRGSRNVQTDHVTSNTQPRISPMTQFSSLHTDFDEATQLQSVSSLPSIFPTSEWLALQALFNATRGPQWRWYGTGARWDFGSSLSTTHNPCYGRWEGVLCSCNLTKPVTIYQQFYPSYGYYDDYTNSTIDASCSVVKLFLNRHNLRGTIPRQIVGLGNLTHLHLRSNSLSGSFPTGLLGLSKLQVLLLGTNRFVGAFPVYVPSWQTTMRVLALNNNSFSSTLPESWSILSRLQYLDLDTNSLQGTLPQAWSALIGLQQLYLYLNSLEGSLPQSWSSLNVLEQFSLDSNSLTGTLPESWSALIGLQRLYLYSNSLQGTLPVSWSALSRLKNLNLYSNSLQGKLPQSWSVVSSFENLYLFDNSFTGTFPRHWSTLSRLEALYLNSNYLTGSIPSEVGSLTSLKLLLLNNNFFAGIIPPSLFRLPSLSILSLALNCLAIESFAASNMCAARNLTRLLMDGIHSASLCGNKQLFVSNSILGLGGTYSLTKEPDGASSTLSYDSSANIAMPLCLLSLPRLTTLHVSGARLQGNLSTIDVDRIPVNLTDLILSHNYLYGSIPPAIQHRTSWTRLDLSFNLLGGTLAPDIAFNASVTTKLDVSNNRLSGAIPRGLLYQPNISILQGNRFSCDLFTTSINLPVHDPYESQYRCNGSEFDISLLVWGCVLVISVLIACLVTNFRFDSSNALLSIKSLSMTLFMSNTSNAGYTMSGVDHLECLLSSVRLFTVKLALAICSLFLVYGILKLPDFNYTQVTVQGAYLVTATQLEGYTPAIIVALLYLVLELGGYVLLRNKMMSKSNNVLTFHGNHSTVSINLSYFARLVNMRSYWVCRYSAIVTANIVFVVFINGAYVAAYFAYSSSFVRLISFALSVFKVSWTRFGVPYLLSFVRNSGKSSTDIRKEALTSARLYTSLVVVNTIIIPSLSIILVAPQCARYVFVSPPTISSSISFCLLYITFKESNGAVESTSCFQSITISSVYTPPFLYSNQCSFALLSGYADVFTYIFVLSGFVVPGMLYLLSNWAHWLSKSNLSDTWLFSIIADVLPRRLLPVEHVHAVRSSWILTRMTHVILSCRLCKRQGTDVITKKESCEISVVGVEFVNLEANCVNTLHNDASFSMNNSVVSGRSPNAASCIPTAANHSETSVSSTLTLTFFKGDRTVAQVNQALSICLSFGVVFPPLCLLGALAIILNSLFVQYSVRSFASSLPVPEPELAFSEPSKLSILSSKPSSSNVINVNGMLLTEIRKTLDAEYLHFSSALWHCLPIPFVASFPVLAFFLWEIVSVSYPNDVGYTIILPVLFLVLAFVCWQLLFRCALLERIVSFISLSLCCKENSRMCVSSCATTSTNNSDSETLSSPRSLRNI